MATKFVREWCVLDCANAGSAIAVGTVAILLFLSLAARAAQPRERWSFAWDPYPQAAQVGYYELEICLSSGCSIQKIVGGFTFVVRDVFVDPKTSGDGTAVLRACRPTGECSGNSNTVVLDRVPPLPPTAVTHGHNDR